MLKREWHIFLTSVMFFTRIPIPFVVPYTKDLLNSAIRYFPLTGAMVGGFGALVFWLGLFVVPQSLALLLSMVATIWLTGAFHEDGFADFCDGYGGGYTPERILEIMKDSRLGTYGTVGLLGMLALKFVSLQNLPLNLIPVVLVSAHVFSRLMPVFLIYTAPYLREDEQAKAKPLGNSASELTVIMAACMGLSVLLFFPIRLVVLLLPVIALVFVLFRAYVLRRTGGYTGDVLGALQQLSELVFYIVAVAYYYY